LPQGLYSSPKQPGYDSGEGSFDCRKSCGAHPETRDCARSQSRARHHPSHTKKNAERIEARLDIGGCLATVTALVDDVIEFDEICVRKSPAYWLWIGVSRLVGQVLGFALGERTHEMLKLAWSDVPAGYRDKPVKTDHWSAYASFFPAAQQGV
jgi:hypothetical protein